MKHTNEVGTQIVNRCIVAMTNAALNAHLVDDNTPAATKWLTEFFSLAAGGCEAGFVHSSGRQSGREQMVER